MTSVTGQQEKGLPGQDSKKKDCQDRTTMQDCQNRTALTYFTLFKTLAFFPAE
jgi:hypothetical protein